MLIIVMVCHDAHKPRFVYWFQNDMACQNQKKTDTCRHANLHVIMAIKTRFAYLFQNSQNPTKTNEVKSLSRTAFTVKKKFKGKGKNFNQNFVLKCWKITKIINIATFFKFSTWEKADIRLMIARVKSRCMNTVCSSVPSNLI